MVKKLFILFALFIVYNAEAQFATATLSKKKVVLEEPVKVKIKVFSPTWFASPLTFSNLQLNGAFIQSFSQTIPGISTINKKKYATLEFYYILFPYQEGELIFPEITLTASIPPEGGYQGKPTTLKTKPITIQVSPVPKNADADHWLVANDVTIANKWSNDLKTAKVGDVIKREITIHAKGTLPSFIDEPEIGTVNFASIYASEPNFIDARDNSTTNGKRIDTYSYLMEEIGEFTIPEVEITWWNPHVSKFYKRKLPDYKITISENTDLASLAKIRDSLYALNRPILTIEAEEEAKLNYKEWIKTGVKIILIILLILILIKILKKINNRFKRKQDRYLDSEKYWFHKVLKEKGGKGLLNSLYSWLDRSTIKIESKTLTAISKEDKELKPEFEALKKELFSSGDKSKYNTGKIKKELIKWKKVNKDKKNKKADLPELN